MKEQLEKAKALSIAAEHFKPAQQTGTLGAEHQGNAEEGGGKFLTDGTTLRSTPGDLDSPESQPPRRMGQYVNVLQEHEDLPDYMTLGHLVTLETLDKWGLVDKKVDLPMRGPAALDDPLSLLKVRQMTPDDLMWALQDVFERYNLWENGSSKSLMDKIRFSKTLRDGESFQPFTPTHP